MENLTNKAYRSNPELRVQLEREARKLRAQEMDRLILAPLARWFMQAFTRSPVRAIPAVRFASSLTSWRVREAFAVCGSVLSTAAAGKRKAAPPTMSASTPHLMRP